MEFDLWPQIQDCLCAADPDAAALADLSWVPIIIDVKKKAPHKHLHYQCRRVFKAKVTLLCCRTFLSYLRFVFNNMKKERMCKHWLNSSCVFRVCVCVHWSVSVWDWLKAACVYTALDVSHSCHWCFQRAGVCSRQLLLFSLRRGRGHAHTHTHTETHSSSQAPPL